MPWLGWIGWVIVGGIVLHALLSVGPHFWTRRDRGGDVRKGLVVFVEPIRWLGICWGRRTTARGLRRAGYEGCFLHFKWHPLWQGFLVLPALRNRRQYRRQALRLARFLLRQRRRHPRRPIHLIAFSGGTYVAALALEQLGRGTVDGVALLGGSFSRKVDLSDALEAAGRLVVSSSVFDWLLCGLGTILLGGSDGRHLPSVGMIGTDQENVIDVRWNLLRLPTGNLGGHFSACSSGYVRSCIWPMIWQEQLSEF